jgi:4-amino-4-deoxy-L-arabinose transferase-like glycosyltransferase
MPRASSISAEPWLLIGLIVLGAALRLATVGSQSLWLDEALSARELHLSFGAMLSSIGASEVNPPLFFVLAWPFVKVFGPSEAGLRSLSVLAGTALIPIAYLCGRELVSRRAGLLAAAFAAVNPFMIWYSQEAREYMLLGAFCGASFLFFARSWREPSRRNLIWWAVFSALAVLTHYFAAFIIVPEAIGLLYRARSRVTAIAIGAVAAVQASLLPHFVSHQSDPVGWIGTLPLSIRIKQVPIAFGLGTLYQSSIVTYGLIGAAALAAIVIALLVIGADSDELRGAGLAAAVAAAVLLLPLALAALGHDYYVPRALIAAWIPLAVVLAAACTSPRTRLPGAALAVVVLGGFSYAQVRIQDGAQYQRPNWRGVARALGQPSGPRAIVAYDGSFAAVPLTLYLHGVPLSNSSAAAVSVDEIDVVGSPYQTTSKHLPTGTRLLSSRQVDSYLVQRFELASALALTPAEIGARARTLLGPAPPAPAVLIQRSSA